MVDIRMTYSLAGDRQTPAFILCRRRAMRLGFMWR